MTLGVFQRTIVDNSGDTIGGATVEVRRESDGALVPLFADRDGTSGVANPATAGPDGFLQFYAARGRYRIKATSGGYARTWRDVPLVDLDNIADPISEGARGDGVADDRFPIAKADGIAAAAGKALRFTFGTYLINSDLTIASNVIFEPGAILKVPTGVTVTFEGGVSAGSRQIFDLSGTGAIVPSRGGQAAVEIRWFGAKGDGTTDDTAAIQAAIGAAEAAGGGVVLFTPGTYLISATLSVNGDCVVLKGSGYNLVAAPHILDNTYAHVLANAATVIQFDASAPPVAMLRFTPTPDDGTQNPGFGGGIDGILFDGQNRATIGVEILSWRAARFVAAVIRCTTICWSLGTLLNGSAPAGAGNSSTSDNYFRIHAATRGLAGNNADTLVGWGDGNAGNFALNTFDMCSFFGQKTDHVHFENSDSCWMYGCRWNGNLTFHASDTGTSGKSVGNSLARHHQIHGSQGPIVAKAATAGSVHSFGNIVLGHSLGNGVPLPVIEDGADLTVLTTGISQDGKEGGAVYGTSRVGVLFAKNVTQAVPSGVNTTVTWEGVAYDELSAGDLLNNKIVVPNGVKKAKASCGIQWDNNSTGRRLVEILLNGGSVANEERVAQNNSGVTLESPWSNVNPGDEYTVRVIQNSGASLDILSNSKVWLNVEFA